MSVSEKCWYCHRALNAADIITAGTTPEPRRQPEPPASTYKEIPPTRIEQKSRHRPSRNWEDGLEGIGGFLIAAIWIGLAGAFLYGLVRFVHWAWYQ